MGDPQKKPARASRLSLPISGRWLPGRVGRELPGHGSAQFMSALERRNAQAGQPRCDLFLGDLLLKTDNSSVAESGAPTA